MSQAPAPERTVEQRLAALEHANDIRTYRADLKRRIKAGEQSVVPLLLHPGAMLKSMKIIDLLLAMPQTGWVKANKTLNCEKVSPSKTLEGLTPRQRDALSKVVAAWERERMKVCL